MTDALDVIDLTKNALRQYYTESNDQLNTETTFEALIEGMGDDLTSYIFESSPYTVLDVAGKVQLIDVPFIIRSWRFAVDQKTERGYVVAFVVTEDNRHFIITDGSTGIANQLRAITEQRISTKHPHPVEGLYVQRGLRVSEYDLTTDKDGTVRAAQAGEKVTGEGKTFYLA
jgi:hypothetical protein